MSDDILRTIADRTRARVAGLHVEPGSASPRRPHDFREALLAPGPRVIAEVKLASPSEGLIAPDADPVAVASDYLAHGAAALSVLTEPEFFRGSPEYLRKIRAAHPEARLLMKDFVVDPVQLEQAAAIGADAVLLIVALLGAETRSYLLRALSLGLTPLVEVHDEPELELAADAGARLIGVNNRNLKTMAVSLDVSERLARLAPEGALLVSESGIRTGADIQRLKTAGYRGFLIGTHFMRSGNPGAALRSLLEAAP